jgi:lipopolysaccharide export system protein LptA
MRLRVVLPALATLACGAVASAQQTTADVPVFRAERIERSAENVLVASGKVEIAMDDLRLQADSATIRLPTAGTPFANITAEGNVVVTTGHGRLRAGRLTLEGVDLTRKRPPQTPQD